VSTLAKCDELFQSTCRARDSSQALAAALPREFLRAFAFGAARIPRVRGHVFFFFLLSPAPPWELFTRLTLFGGGIGCWRPGNLLQSVEPVSPRNIDFSLPV